MFKCLAKGHPSLKSIVCCCLCLFVSSADILKGSACLWLCLSAPDTPDWQEFRPHQSSVSQQGCTPWSWSPRSISGAITAYCNHCYWLNKSCQNPPLQQHLLCFTHFHCGSYTRNMDEIQFTAALSQCSVPERFLCRWAAGAPEQSPSLKSKDTSYLICSWWTCQGQRCNLVYSSGYTSTCLLPPHAIPASNSSVQLRLLYNNTE